MESDERTTSATADAAAQLAALRADRLGMAERARQPWWYDPAGGVLVLLFLGSYSTHSAGWIGAAAAVFLVGLLLMRRGYQRATGMWVSGVRPGRTRIAIAAWAVLYAVVFSGSGLLEFAAGVRGAMVVGGAVLGVGLVVISRWWNRLYVAELREDL
jgi:hypothetical protein